MPDTKEMNLDVNLIIDDAVEESLRELIRDEVKKAVRENRDGITHVLKRELEKYG